MTQYTSITYMITLFYMFVTLPQFSLDKFRKNELHIYKTVKCTYETAKRQN